MSNHLKSNLSSLTYILFFSSCFLGLFLSGCKSAKKGQSGQLKEYSADFLLKKLASQNIEVEWLTAKAKISFKDNSQSRKATSYIRMRKDSVIWMNVKKLGIEAARILITTDSIYILDRINKQFVINDFSYIERQYHLPANFKALQNLILGNPLFLSEVVLNAAVKNDRYHLASTDEKSISSDYWLNGKDFSLEKMLFLDLRNNRKVEVTQSEYSPLEEFGFFSYLRSLDLSSPETGDLNIEMKLSDLQINTPKSIRFEIPEHYTKID